MLDGFAIASDSCWIAGVDVDASVVVLSHEASVMIAAEARTSLIYIDLWLSSSNNWPDRANVRRGAYESLAAQIYRI